jgi:hypothetical protein
MNTTWVNTAIGLATIRAIPVFSLSIINHVSIFPIKCTNKNSQWTYESGFPPWQSLMIRANEFMQSNSE